ncbi:M20/M25/M40 family metallo-hydrolase [Rothia terrae]|uniref:M20/M25/M40 family metallo-hydrolase n=1 Tax=Rothia terrae TaxID=396015 RepID=UPI001446848D|nr:M20/M25/M40 family metallo-hydrolase [Rothia terrae]NKZ33469.1 M20/M25/M40 family metallo-hydrolase [Rothia terrae]
MNISPEFDFSNPPQLAQKVSDNLDIAMKRLSDLVAIPSIAWEAFDRTQVHKSAEKVKELALEVGFESAEILTATYGQDAKEGMPAVVAHKPAKPGYPTVLLYAHHDVQPVGDENEWETKPFEATQVGDRLFGRGAADDKAGVVAHLTAFETVKEAMGADFNAGVTLFIEGEEEAGSPSFASFLETYSDKLQSDVIVVADSTNWQKGVPALTTSLRGVASGEISVRVADHDVHSGMFGGPLLDAHTVMVRALASLHDSKGKVAVEGLVRGSEPEVEYTEENFRTDSGILNSMRLAGEGSLSSRLWTQPAISIIGMNIADVDRASNTIASRSTAKISVRLAPGSNPQEAHQALEKHFKNLDLWGAEISYSADDSGLPFSTDTSSTGAQLALRSFETAWGVTPVSTGLGGSIPFIADLKEVFPTAEILITGIEDPDTRAHSANESLYVPDFEKAIVAEALMLSALSRNS